MLCGGEVFGNTATCSDKWIMYPVKPWALREGVGKEAPQPCRSLRESGKASRERRDQEGQGWFANTREGSTENSPVHGLAGAEELTPTQPQGVKDPLRKAWSPEG